MILTILPSKCVLPLFDIRWMTLKSWNLVNVIEIVKGSYIRIVFKIIFQFFIPCQSSLLL
jgi:hypothetical protein